MNNKQIPIIDLFAGPGGLGEGFTSVVDENNNRFFKIALSIEKDEFAHKTLTLRSFLRQFPYKKLPTEYYDFLKSEKKDVESLYQKYPEQAAKAKHEAWQFELGSSEHHSLVDKRIKESLKGEKDFLLIGGPPCQAYSLVGRARRQEAEGLNKNDPRVYLYLLQVTLSRGLTKKNTEVIYQMAFVCISNMMLYLIKGLYHLIMTLK